LADWLKFGAATVAANGGRIPTEDQLYHDGGWEPDVYHNIRETYAWPSERNVVLEQFGRAAEAAIYVAGVGVHQDAGGTQTQFGSSVCGEAACRVPCGRQYPVDLITVVRMDDLSRYRVVVIDQPLPPSDHELRALESCV